MCGVLSTNYILSYHIIVLFYALILGIIHSQVSLYAIKQKICGSHVFYATTDFAQESKYIAKFILPQLLWHASTDAKDNDHVVQYILHGYIAIHVRMSLLKFDSGIIAYALFINDSYCTYIISG